MEKYERKQQNNVFNRLGGCKRGRIPGVDQHSMVMAMAACESIAASGTNPEITHTCIGRLHVGLTWVTWSDQQGQAVGGQRRGVTISRLMSMRMIGLARLLS
jgi:hypothetical protein